jgi:hypothetical protein
MKAGALKSRSMISRAIVPRGAIDATATADSWGVQSPSTPPLNGTTLPPSTTNSAQTT